MHEDKAWVSQWVCGKAVGQKKVKFHMLGCWGKILYIGKARWFVFMSPGNCDHVVVQELLETPARVW